LIFKGREEKENGAVLFEHRGSLGLGGVCGKHRFHTHLGQGLQDFLGRKASRLELGELLTPESRLVSKTMLDFAQTPRLCRGVLLDHVQKLESDGVGLLDARRRLIDVVRLAVLLPWQELRRLVLSQFDENLLETLHQVVQVRIDLRKPRNNIVSRCLHPGAESF
jgi:hypothetical protein